MIRFHWNEKEKAAYQRDLLGRRPPSSAPAGYQMATQNSQLVPGMPAKIGFYGEWKDAEILTNSVRDTVKVADSQNLRLLSRDGWIAISPDTIKKAQSNPGSFEPSVHVLPDTTSVIPAGYTVVTADMKLIPGVPVRAIWLNKVVDAIVRSIDGSQLANLLDVGDGWWFEIYFNWFLVFELGSVERRNRSEKRDLKCGLNSTFCV